MFQYATARTLALRSDAELVIDTWSGFVRDYQYKRFYELAPFPIVARAATPLERYPFWLDRLACKFFTPNGDVVKHYWFGDLVKETKREYLSEVSNYTVTRPTWMSGYWQAAAYFKEYQSRIEQELQPSRPAEVEFVRLGREMRSRSSVAVGVRLYEESRNPNAHSADGKLKSIADVNEAARKLSETDTKLHFYVFCTHRSPLLEELCLPGEITYVTHEGGFEGTFGRLWLLTQCRHHILTNSSFYWWGAWLSAANYPNGDSEIYAADNFINKDSILPSWHQF